jgi:RNA polymerase sigma-70 factor, ECF subfamily
VALVHKKPGVVRGRYEGTLDRIAVATIREFYEENSRALFTYALALTRHPASAEDAVHDAICRVLARPAPPAELRPYVFRCVRNAAIDAWRRERPSEEAGILDLATLDDATFDRALWAQVERFLFDLPQDEMETIVLHVFDGLSFRDVASVKQVPLNTAASWYRRGLAKLRERILGEVPCEKSTKS